MVLKRFCVYGLHYFVYMVQCNAVLGSDYFTHTIHYCCFSVPCLYKLGRLINFGSATGPEHIRLVWFCFIGDIIVYYNDLYWLFTCLHL